MTCGFTQPNILAKRLCVHDYTRSVQYLVKAGEYPPLADDIDPASLPENPCFRIPALAAFPAESRYPGRLVTAFDIRPDFRDLPGEISIGVRVSDDFGQTWSPLHILQAASEGWGFGDASLIDTDQGKMLALFVASRGHNFWDDSTPGDNWRLLQARSHDGLNWEITDLTAQLWDQHTGSMFFASGNGIQLREGAHAGRLLQPLVRRERHHTDTIAGVAISDDFGEHWRMARGTNGLPTGIPGGDESKIVELSGGMVLLSSRDYPTRRWAISRDGGESFGSVWADVPDPGCNGGLARVGDTLVLTNLFPDCAVTLGAVGSLGADSLGAVSSRGASSNPTASPDVDPSKGKSAGRQDWAARRNLVVRRAKIPAGHHREPQISSPSNPNSPPEVAPHADETIAWGEPEVIYAPAAAYSVALTHGQHLGVLFECGDPDGTDSPYGSLAFADILTTYGT